MTDENPATAFTAERKNVYGNDMLYVSDHAGSKVGQMNLGSGKTKMSQPELRPTFELFVAEWCSANALPVPFTDAVSATDSTSSEPDHPTPVADPEPSVDTARDGDDESVDHDLDDQVSDTNESWDDLASNKAGQGIADKAAELRSEAPILNFAARIFGVHTEERAYRVGAAGERETGRRLSAKLDDGWQVIHSVPVGDGDSDIDHVAIGPGGVFTLNSKYHVGKNVWVRGDTIKVSGQNQPYVRNSRHEAKRASRLLSDACGFSVEVDGLVVVTAKQLTIKAQPDDVQVVPMNKIGKWLKRRKPVLAQESVDAIYEIARRSTTWKPGPR